jgi:hypothetical protein
MQFPGPSGPFPVKKNISTISDVYHMKIYIVLIYWYLNWYSRY